MTLPEANALADRMSRRFGIEFTSAVGTNEAGDFIDLRPVELEPNEGFRVRIQAGWRSVEVSFLLDTFSGRLLREMAKADSERRHLFANIADQALRDKAEVKLAINDSEIDPTKPDVWPSEWRSFSLLVRKSPLDWSGEGGTRLDLLSKWAGPLLSMVMLLLPMVDDGTAPALDDEMEGLPEGARTKIEVNRYERSRLNRAICLQLRGTTCSVCGTKMDEVYGEIGHDFIHVHHLVPLAAMKAGYRVDPAHDLVPICPNCHAMAHRKSPPIPPDELARMIREASSHGARQ